MPIYPAKKQAQTNKFNHLIIFVLHSSVKNENIILYCHDDLFYFPWQQLLIRHKK